MGKIKIEQFNTVILAVSNSENENRVADITANVSVNSGVVTSVSQIRVHKDGCFCADLNYNGGSISGNCFSENGKLSASEAMAIAEEFIRECKEEFANIKITKIEE